MKKRTPDFPLPNLTFPTFIYTPKSIPMDLRILLYKGASAESGLSVFNKIASGEFGNPIQTRIELVQRIHGEMNAALISGKSPETVRNRFVSLRAFFRLADKYDLALSINTVEMVFRQWADHLHSRVIKKEISLSSAYSIALVVSSLLSTILEKSIPLIKTTRLRLDERYNPIAVDEQDLGEIYKFGRVLIDIVNCLDIKAIYGALPVKMELRNGITWNEWSGMSSIGSLKTFLPSSKRIDDQKKMFFRRSARELEHSIRTRSSVINLRLQAEFFIFIAQTGMNLTQARKLRMSQANYTSAINGYLVKTYKNRKKGSASFEIFSEYRDHFEKYLAWRKELFKDVSELLFPFLDHGIPTSSSSTIVFKKIRSICKLANVKFYGPRELRKTRINWLHRQSGDHDLTADQAQHTKQVLLKNYLRPSFQVAKVELTKFFIKNDPTLQSAAIGPAPAPGICNGIPAPAANMPSEAPKPDCTHPGGCLFCEHHRDIDSEDYVWSATSMKHLNRILITNYRSIEKNKPDIGSHIEAVMQILTQKLKWFESSNKKRRQWVEESLARCNEGDFHPHWGYLIESAEA